MTSSTSKSNYGYVIIRLEMSESINGIAGSLFCHYGETDDAFLIGGLVEPVETLTTSVIRHCRRLVDFYPKPNQRFYLAFYFLQARDFENNLGTDVGIIPCFWGDICMKDHEDNNGIWAETVRTMRSKVFYEALQLPGLSGLLGVTANLSRFLLT